MSYIKRDDVPVQPGEQAVELGDGTMVAVACTRTPDGASIVVHATARAIAADGAAVQGTQGPVCTELTHRADLGAIDRHGADAIARDCLLAVLGEEPEIVRWAAGLLASVSIRAALLADASAGQVDAGGVL